MSLRHAVDTGDFLVGALFGFVVPFEQLGYRVARASWVAEQIGGSEDAYNARVALFSRSENVVKIAPEFLEGLDEFGVLVRLAGEGIDFFLFLDGVLQVAAEAFKIVMRFSDGPRVGAVAEIAKLEADRVDIALDADEEAGIVPIEINGIGLEPPQAVELKESVGGEARHRCQGDEQP